ncbi:hypothetical protein AJ79_05198 [Helicocarpus griseus UAMH5409]|uniref:nitrilase n=1 Tax=Helicocarpus griseus UAMH5409 TaxID=1447875 RepID=A0A2B7XQN1_9EURO|nr:hypothetical protein AJ79_05198 [Helicocarpus griseus UAMH5409]
MPGPILRVAITQAEPVYLDLAATVEKTVKLIEEAAEGGAKLIAFPECWIPGYPAWIWQRPVDPPTTTRYIQNSLRLLPTPSPELLEIQSAAKRHSIAVALGFSEATPSHSLYISQCLISPQGTIALHRRKLKPTHMERTVFGDGYNTTTATTTATNGDSDSNSNGTNNNGIIDNLTNVAPIDFGAPIGVVKIGLLACWEHTQPLLKYHTFSLGEEVHVAMWPPVDPHGGVDAPGLWSMSAEGCMGLSRAYAVEGGAFVLHCTAVCGEEGIEKMQMKTVPEGGMFQRPGGGHSAAIGVDGRRLMGALGEGDPAVEGIVFADLDLERIVANRAFLDVVGHYSRPDLLWLGVEKGGREVVVGREGK